MYDWMNIALSHHQYLRLDLQNAYVVKWWGYDMGNIWSFNIVHQFKIGQLLNMALQMLLVFK